MRRGYVLKARRKPRNKGTRPGYAGPVGRKSIKSNGCQSWHEKEWDDQFDEGLARLETMFLFNYLRCL